MFDSILTILQTDAANLYAWWDSIDGAYRGGGCMLLGLFLMWEATKTAEERDRRFFVVGGVALTLLAYGAVLLVQR